MKNKISGVYKIENLITGDFYIGSSKDIKRRWVYHKAPSTWKRLPNNPMYNDMKKYGVENFEFTILCEVEPEQLTDMEQRMIEELHPTYNNYNAKGWNVERRKESLKKYCQSERFKEYNKKYQQSKKGKETHKKYYSRLCFYNGETLTFEALLHRFQRAGVEHPTLEAKKYLVL